MLTNQISFNKLDQEINKISGLENLAQSTNPSINQLDRNINNRSLSKEENSLNRLNKDQSNFLQMLMTQAKNQDPTSPMESAEFTQQLIGFSGVEQQITTNKYLKEITNSYQQLAINTASSYIGKTVDVDNSHTKLSNDQAIFSYDLLQDAKSTQITILDSNKNPIYSQIIDAEVDNINGKHQYIWDGKDNNGNKLKDGDYEILVKAYDKNDNPVNTKTTKSGRVTAVNNTNKDISLLVDDQLTDWHKIMYVTDSYQSDPLFYYNKNIEADYEITGQANIKYQLEKDYSEATIQITDQNNNIIKTIPVNQHHGDHNIWWDGKDMNDNLALKQDYHLSLELKDKHGIITKVIPKITGKINNIEFEHNKPILKVDDQPVNLAKLTKITEHQDQINLEANKINQSTELNITQLLPYLNKEITANHSLIELKDKQAFINYQLGDDISQLEILIYDEQNQAINKLAAQTTKGNYSLFWNGLDFNDQPVADGIYRIKLKANQNQSTKITDNLIKGLVSKVELVDQQANLEVDGFKIQLGNVVSINA